MDISDFFEELREERSIDAVKKAHPELTDEEINKFFDEAISLLSKNGVAELYVDGASSSNPGNAGIGVVLKVDDRVVENVSKPIGIATNNVAEYTALIEGLKIALDKGYKRVKVYSDSELVVKQLKGIYRVKDEGLSKLYKHVKELEKRFEKIEIVHINRENNKQADRLAKNAAKLKII